MEGVTACAKAAFDNGDGSSLVDNASGRRAPQRARVVEMGQDVLSNSASAFVQASS